MKEMNDDIRRCIELCVGQQCCRQHVGKDLSLDLGFGEVVRIKSAIGEADHGKWEIGTYNGSWRIIQDCKLVCGSQSSVESIDELRQQVNSIEWGSLIGLQQLSDYDVRIELDNGILVDFLGTFSGDDELVHIFCPDELVVTFSIGIGWAKGRSDEPWLA